MTRAVLISFLSISSNIIYRIHIRHDLVVSNTFFSLPAHRYQIIVPFQEIVWIYSSTQCPIFRPTRLVRTESCCQWYLMSDLIPFRDSLTNQSSYFLERTEWSTWLHYTLLVKGVERQVNHNILLLLVNLIMGWHYWLLHAKKKERKKFLFRLHFTRARAHDSLQKIFSLFSLFYY